MKVWVLFLDNVEGENSVELYSTREKASAALKNYAKQYAHEEDFTRIDDYHICWFDTGINWHLACISMTEQEVY